MAGHVARRVAGHVVHHRVTGPVVRREAAIPTATSANHRLCFGREHSESAGSDGQLKIRRGCQHGVSAFHEPADDGCAAGWRRT